MKLICCLFFFFVLNELYGQNCKKLERRELVKRVKFGSQIPADLKVCANNPGNTYFHINYDSLSQDCKKKYKNLFTFLSVPFSFADIGTNKEGQIMTVELYSLLEENYHSDSISYKPPDNFLKIYNKLVSMFGNPSSTKEASHFDSVLMKYSGLPRTIYWICNYISIELQVSYGAHNKIMNSLHIRIKDRNFEIIEEAKIAQ